MLKENVFWPGTPYLAKLTIKCKIKIKTFTYASSQKKFTSHAPFLRKLLEGVLQQNKGRKHARGPAGLVKQWIQSEGERRGIHKMEEKGDHRAAAVR